MSDSDDDAPLLAKPNVNKTKASEEKEQASGAAPPADRGTGTADAPDAKKRRVGLADDGDSYRVQRNPDGTQFIDLGGKKRVSKSEFRGNKYIDMREYYEDKSSGQMKPGAKGCSLTVDGFSKLLKTAPSASTLRGHIVLEGMKRISQSEFRGNNYIDVREYYKDKASGEDKP